MVLIGPEQHLWITAETQDCLTFACALPPSSAGDSAGAHTAEHTVNMENCQVFVSG